MNTSTSSSSSQQYSVLLSTVSELRNDLEKAMTKLQSLEELNQGLTQNYEIVKEELIDTRKKYVEAKENYMQTAAKKVEMERQNDIFLERIKTQLAEKTKEFDMQREKLKPQDIDSIRIKIQEDLEIPHKQQKLKMQEETEKYKELFNKAKHDLEMHKTEFEFISSSQIRHINALKDERNIIEETLTDKIHKLQDSQITLEKDETIRFQALKVYELEHMIELQKEESRTLRTSRDNAINELVTISSKSEEIISQLRGRVILVETDRNSIEEKFKRLSNENERKDSQIHSLNQTIDEINEKNEINNRQNNELIQQLAIEKEEHVKSMEETKDKFQLELTNWSTRCENASKKLHEREETIKQLQRSSNELQIRTESNDRELRRSHQQQISELNKRYTNNEMELSNLRKESFSNNNQLTLKNEQNKIELENCKSEISRLKREKDVLHDKYRDLERRYESNTSKTSLEITELKGKIVQNELNLSDYRNKETKLQRDCNQYKTLNRELQQSLDLLSIKYEKLENENKNFIETIQNETKKRLEILQLNYKTKLDSLKLKLTDNNVLKLKYKDLLDKEKLRSENYKQRTMQASRQNKLLAGIVNNDELVDNIDNEFHLR